MRKYEFKKTRIKTEAGLLLMGRQEWQLISVKKGFWSFLLGRKFIFRREVPNPFSTMKDPK
jgi:hypothetical protein